MCRPRPASHAHYRHPYGLNSSRDAKKILYDELQSTGNVFPAGLQEQTHHDTQEYTHVVCPLHGGEGSRCGRSDCMVTVLPRRRESSRENSYTAARQFARQKRTGPIRAGKSARLNSDSVIIIGPNNNNNNNNLICIAPECQRLQRRWRTESTKKN